MAKFDTSFFIEEIIMNNIIDKKTMLLGSALALYFLSFSSMAECDLAQGKKQFNKCIACHSVEQGAHKMGPSLHQVIGRKAGSLTDFYYSDAMKNSDIIWSEKTLSAFLEKPMKYIEGTTMPFSGIKKAEQRQALVCYLQQLN